MRAVSAVRCALRLALLSAVLVAASGCATVPSGAVASKDDPWESFNRNVFVFNDKVDEAVLKPIATVYRDVVPQIVRTGIGNVLSNIGDVWSTANHLLQGKIHSALDSGLRVAVNTLMGLGGLLDPATEMGLTRQREDFGQTLGRWGVGSGPYLVLPFLGPSTLRDAGALVLDSKFSPSSLPPTDKGTYSVLALEVIDLRAGLLDSSRLLNDVALDKYTFLRQAFLARRLDQVHDGSPPLEAFVDDGAEPAPPAPVRPAPK